MLGADHYSCMTSFQNKNRQILSVRHSLLRLPVIVGGFLLIVVFWVYNRKADPIVPLPLNSIHYLFSPIEDHLLENPANWYPDFPGLPIARNQHVMIEGEACFTGFDLQVAGAVHISIGSSIFSPNGKILVLAGGELINNGEIMVASIENQGLIQNNLSATIDIGSFQCLDGGFTHNARSALFTVSNSIVNQGVFNNYSLCTIGKQFINEATFNQMPDAELRVNGTKVDSFR